MYHYRTWNVCRILLVDPHCAARRGLRALLEADGRFEIVGETDNGRDGLKLAKRLNPDVVIMDLLLPSMNGFDLARQLQQCMPAVEMLLFTVEDQPELIVDIIRHGVRGVVSKSDPEPSVLAALEALACGQTYLPATAYERLLCRLDIEANGYEALLSDRERSVVQLVAEGQTNKQIAYLLSIGIKTVECHRSNAMQKLKLQRTADLVRFAVRSNMVAA